MAGYHSLHGHTAIRPEEAYGFALTNIMGQDRDRDEFARAFPEHQAAGAAELHALPRSHKAAIEEWFYSGDWIKDDD